MKSWKIFLSIGIVIFIIGIAVFISGFAASGWNVPDLDIKTFTAQEDYNSLDLSLSAGEMKIEFYNGEKINIDYPTQYPYSYNVSESDGKLKVAPASNSIFLGWLPWYAKPKIIVRIPFGKVTNLKLSVSAGKVTVENGEFGAFNLALSAGIVSVSNVKCASFNANVSAGTANVVRLDCSVLNMDLSAGSANITVIGKKSEYNITVDKSAGSCNVGGQQGTVAGKVIDIDLSAGSVNIGFVD